MIWGRTSKQRIYDKESQWPEGKNWYAWRPVILVDGRWIWREWVWRETEHDWGDSIHYYFTDEKELLKIRAEQKKYREEREEAKKNDND